MLDKKERYSIMNPYFEEIKESLIQYESMWEYNSKSHKKIHDFLYKKINGVIASDLDYVNPLINNPKSVSYTHLDVYKRQVITCWFLPSFKTTSKLPEIAIKI